MWECKSDLHFEVNAILNFPNIAYTNRQPLSSLGFDFCKRVLATWSPIFSQFPSLMSFSLYFSGVYFTSFGPGDHSVTSIRRNNFDDRGWALRGNNLLYKLEWVVQVEMSISEVTDVPANGRNVLTCTRATLTLVNISIVFTKTPTPGRVKDESLIFCYLSKSLWETLPKL